MSDIVTKQIQTSIGAITQNPCSDSNLWPDCSVASVETEDRGFTKSGIPYFRIKSSSVIYTPPVLCPVGLSVYAAKKSEASITLSYQKGTLIYENGQETWIGGDWFTLRELTPSELATTMQRFEIPLDGINSTDIVRFRIKSGGISLYVDDVNYIERYTSQTETPSFSIAPGEVISGTSIAINGEAESVIYYSLDGGMTYDVYNEPLVITSSSTLMAFAVKEGKSTSWTIRAQYTISDSTVGIDNTDAETNAQKILRDGKILIVRNGKMYDLNGREL